MRPRGTGYKVELAFESADEALALAAPRAARRADSRPEPGATLRLGAGD